MAAILAVGEASVEQGEYQVQVTWAELEGEDSTWEPLSVICHNASRYVERGLKKQTRLMLTYKYEMRL